MPVLLPMDNWITQEIEFIGLIFFVLAFQQNNRKRILILMLLGQIIFLLHFSLPNNGQIPNIRFLIRHQNNDVVVSSHWQR